MDYRNSHSSKNYGSIYSKTYQNGYFCAQWEKLEKNILGEIFSCINKEKENASYLDFACGTGRIISFAELFFSETCGVDISEEMLIHARNSCKKSDLIKTDLTKTYLKKKFDIITSFRFFLHAQNDLKNEALKALRAHISDNGMLIVNIHVNSKSPLGWAYRIRNFLYRKEVAVTLDVKTFDETLLNNGFKIEKVIYYSFFPRVGWLFSNFYNKHLEKFDKFVNKFSFIPKKWAQSYIVIAKPIEEECSSR